MASNHYTHSDRVYFSLQKNNGFGPKVKVRIGWRLLLLDNEYWSLTMLFEETCAILGDLSIR